MLYPCKLGEEVGIFLEVEWSLGFIEENTEVKAQSQIMKSFKSEVKILNFIL